MPKARATPATPRGQPEFLPETAGTCYTGHPCSTGVLLLRRAASPEPAVSGPGCDAPVSPHTLPGRAAPAAVPPLPSCFQARPLARMRREAPGAMGPAGAAPRQAMVLATNDSPAQPPCPLTGAGPPKHFHLLPKGFSSPFAPRSELRPRCRPLGARAGLSPARPRYQGGSPGQGPPGPGSDVPGAGGSRGRHFRTFQ